MSANLVPSTASAPNLALVIAPLLIVAVATVPDKSPLTPPIVVPATSVESGAQLGKPEASVNTSPLFPFASLT